MTESLLRNEVVDVEVARATGVAVSYADGAVCRFELAELRASCPCAQCRSLRDRGEPAWRPGADNLSVTDAELVGRWGLSLTWSDGHSTGIYPWESLRQWSDDRAAAGAPEAPPSPS